ncbi:hypothetical protein PGT21_015203 [Puccinia graminis f. sp. tritici]|uniref:Uncharacterized protein n=1 Tax=Puccinia graminis f. sp. tritici TaxID=56615 RepID=A0A5B0NG11_PUCGR|nr:hypothetical protein PGT21_015203 [Puccinia graminis f. sp. tritici]
MTIGEKEWPSLRGCVSSFPSKTVVLLYMGSVRWLDYEARFEESLLTSMMVLAEYDSSSSLTTSAS